MTTAAELVRFIRGRPIMPVKPTGSADPRLGYNQIIAKYMAEPAEVRASQFATFQAEINAHIEDLWKNSMCNQSKKWLGDRWE